MTLVFLVENHGQLVEKSDLLSYVWSSAYVEEASVSKCIWEIRTALSDDSRASRYIETVPKHGYRFIADVKVSDSGEQSLERSNLAAEKTTTAPSNATSEPNRKGQRMVRDAARRRILFLALGVIVITVFCIGAWYALRNGITMGSSPSAQLSFEKLSSDGRVGTAAISPDGKNVVFADEAGGSVSLWLRNLESATNIQIIPPTENWYYGLAITPDGNNIYFVRNQQTAIIGKQSDIFRMPIYGGVPTKIISEVQGSISISGDGKRISFFRCALRNDDYCSLWVAESNGANEKRLISNPQPMRIGGNQISPDGTRIAFAAGRSDNWANEFRLLEVDIQTGVEREITQERFFNIKAIAWLPDQQGLLVTARKYPDNSFRIWQVSTATGKVKALTNDSEDYSFLTLSADASLMVATKIRPDFHLNIFKIDGTDPETRSLGNAATVSFTPDGNLVYSSEMSGNHDLWAINADGSDRRQLTNDLGVDVNALASSDNRYVFFTSNRTGEAQIWRMNTDGSDQMQITLDEGGFPQFVSPDNQWLYYTGSKQRFLMRIPIAGGQPETILTQKGLHFDFSPDGSHAAFAESGENGRHIAIASIPDGQTVGTFEFPNKSPGILHLAWAPDGKSFYYVWPDESADRNNLWQQALIGGPPSRVANLGRDELRETASFSISPDGKSFAIIQGSWKHDAVLIRGLNKK